MDRRQLLTGLAATAVAPSLMGSTADELRAFDVGESRVRLTIAAGDLAAARADVQKWVEDGCRAVADWYGGFPVHPLDLRVLPGHGRGVYGGVTYGGSSPRIRINVGHGTPLKAMYDDWVLVHELVHLAFPNVHRRHHWIEEGLSTYVEPWVRIAAGQISAEKAWYDLVTGLPQGQPGPGDRGLDHTPTWGRTYWGGALYCLLVDLELRRKETEIGLRQALIGIRDAGGSMHVTWDIADALRAGDKATGATVLASVYETHRATPVTVDLDAIWRELGVVRSGRTVRFDDSAPGAAIRRAIDGTG